MRGVVFMLCFLLLAVSGCDGDGSTTSGGASQFERGMPAEEEPPANGEPEPPANGEEEPPADGDGEPAPPPGESPGFCCFPSRST